MTARTPSGELITCDGCAAPVEVVTDAMRHPVPREVALAVYGRDDLVYIVCGPLPDGTQPCLVLARLSDELYEAVRCRVLGCDGTRCRGLLRDLRGVTTCGFYTTAVSWGCGPGKRSSRSRL